MNTRLNVCITAVVSVSLGLVCLQAADAQTRPGNRPIWVGPGGQNPHSQTPSIPTIPHVPHVPVQPHPHPVPVPPHPNPVPPTPGPTPYHPPVYPDYQPNPIPVVPSDNQPVVEPEANELPVPVVEPEPNNPLGDDVRPITQQDLDTWKSQVQKQNEKLIKELSSLTEGKLSDALAGLHDQLNHGQLGGQALADLAHKIQPLVHGNPAAQLAASKLLFRLNNNNRLIRLLIGARLNINITVNVNLFGGPGIIGWLPFFPFGRVIVINNGVWFAGMGGCCGPDPWFYNGGFPQAIGLPYGVGQPVPESQLPPVTSGVVLENIGQNPINYSVNGRGFTMQPTFCQHLPAGQTWTVTFDRGGPFGRARYGLAAGTYRFTPTEKGWDLFQHDFQATLDNSGNRFTFRYVLNNQRQSLAENQSRSLASKYPMQIRFDNGAGQKLQKMLENGSYRVALADGGTIDLFPADAVKTPVPIAELARQYNKPPKNIFADPKEITPALFGDEPGKKETPAPPEAATTPSLFGEGK